MKTKNLNKLMGRHKLFIVVIVVLGAMVFIDLTNIDRYIHKNVCLFFDLIFESNCPDFYDLPIWEVAVAFGTLATAYFAFAAIRESNKRLKIEQTPYVVVQHVEKKPSMVEISIKNVGRGPALHVTCSNSDKFGDRNLPFFLNKEPHSVNLASGDTHDNWITERQTFEKLASSEGFKHFYLYYESQLHVLYRTYVKIKDVSEDRGDNLYVIMENRVEELGKDY